MRRWKLNRPASTYEEHLTRVSRSFAFCIEQLDRPLRDWVGLGYLLCRMADTVEDSTWEKRDDQSAAFAQLLSFLARPAKTARIIAWTAQIPSEIPEGERLLLEDAPRILGDLHALPPKVRTVLRRTVASMVRGMDHFCEEGRGAAAPTNMAEANQYCFFVAGIVGELLTDLVAQADPAYRPSASNYADAFHFGLFLQKINLLKDQRADAEVKRFLVPSREKMRASLRVDARLAFRYIQGIPLSQRGYRTFCAWSFFLGIASLPWIDRAWEEGRDLKISRAETAALLAKVSFNIDDNAALAKLFEASAEAGREKIPVRVGRLPPCPDWFGSLYRGKLKSRYLPELGFSRAPAMVG